MKTINGLHPLQKDFVHLNELFAEIFQRYGSAPAFGHLGAEISYSQLDRLTRRFAAWLQLNTPLKPGDRLAVQLPNLMQYPLVLIAALRAGLVLVNTNPLYTADELLTQLKDSGAKAIVAFTPLAQPLSEIIAETDIHTVILAQLGDLHGWKGGLVNQILRWKKPYPPAHWPAHLNPIQLSELLKQPLEHHWVAPSIQTQDLALLQYTGGTTGTAKAAMLTHANLLANLQQISELLESYITPGRERLLQPLPIYHVYAFMLSLSLFSFGSRCELVPNPRDIPGLAKLFQRYKPTFFAGINPLFNALLQNDLFKKLNFSDLRITISGGMALSPALAEQWALITGCDIAEGYGLTECSPVVSVNPPDQTELGSVGPLLSRTQVEIRDEQRQNLPQGAVGEIWVKGPQVMLGYWQQTEETRRVLGEDGWLDTGDIGCFTDSGRLKIIDRSKEVISVSGFKVYPTELENVVNAMPDVMECAAIGLPDEHHGEKIKLYVIPRHAQVSAEEIRNYCRERLTAYKIPKCIEFCDSLPRTPVGKVLRRALRQQALEKITRAPKTPVQTRD
ncbi:AMP-binding protein [Nitrincola tapanii]|uniref:Long-chain-fatty-acid--CoA ligase n=1 Tax=Nitrincola tapanii TaxID=1708751 RepID=A0A5A9W4F8_9GAMM|nr:AMP-binding protein [Nitrincola tapanii]KAA0875656.1 long-chain fatty acid--CoA ligase [Nitrincola tapanii]